jgi:hypothetical protein
VPGVTTISGSVDNILREAIDHLAGVIDHTGVDHTGVDHTGVDPLACSDRLVPWAVVASHIKTTVQGWVDG